MWLQLSTGRDSFRAQENSQRRNVAVQAHVRVNDDGDGNSVIPLFAAYQKKLKGFAKSSVISVIPATDKFAETDAGQWFVTRYEVLPGTEIMIEYRHRTGSTGFGEEIEYLLLIADPKAPLWNIRLDMPYHFLSNVPSVFFEGRFELVKDMSQISKSAASAWVRKFNLPLDDGVVLTDYLDPNMDDDSRFFTYIKVEDALEKSATVEIKEDASGASRVQIKRLRKIKLK